MPPSIADNRQSAQHALTHDDGNQHHQSQAVRDFQSRKKLLAGSANVSETKNSSKSSISIKRSNKKRATTNSKEKQTCSTLETTLQNTPAAPEGTSSTAAAAALGTGTGTGYGGGMMNNSLGGLGALGGYGMAGMGYGMYGGMGMMGSPYMMGGGGPLNGLNQFLFGIQTAIYSLTSAVQVIGMNTHALHQLLDAASSMVDHALTTFHEMRALEATERENETDEEKMRRRRLKALRWGLCLAASYAAFRLIRNIVSARKRGRQRRIAGGGEPFGYNSSSMLPSPSSYGGYSPYAQQSSYMSQYGSNAGMGMYGSGGYGSSLGYYGGGGGGYY